MGQRFPRSKASPSFSIRWPFLTARRRSFCMATTDAWECRSRSIMPPPFLPPPDFSPHSLYDFKDFGQYREVHHSIFAGRPGYDFRGSAAVGRRSGRHGTKTPTSWDGATFSFRYLCSHCWTIWANSWRQPSKSLDKHKENIGRAASGISADGRSCTSDGSPSTIFSLTFRRKNRYISPAMP